MRSGGACGARYKPARRCSRYGGGLLYTEQNRRRAGNLSGELQAPRRRQIQQSMRPAGFHQYGGDALGADGFLGRPEKIFHRRRINKHEALQASAIRRQAVAIGEAFSARFMSELQPDEAAVSLGRNLQRRRQGETEGGGRVAAVGGAEFLQNPQPERRRRLAAKANCVLTRGRAPAFGFRDMGAKP